MYISRVNEFLCSSANAVDNALLHVLPKVHAAWFVAFYVCAHGNLCLPPVFLLLCHKEISVPSIPDSMHRLKEVQSSPALVQICCLVDRNRNVDINLWLKGSWRKWPSCPIELGADYECEKHFVQKYIGFYEEKCSNSLHFWYFFLLVASNYRIC